jgi:hypothetical protein
MASVTTNLPFDIHSKDISMDSLLNPEAALQINASIACFKGRYYCAYRSDFFDRHYDPKNHVTELNADFSISTHYNLSAENGNSAFEDIRLFEHRGRLMALYSYLPKEGDGWLWENGVGIGEIDTARMMLVNQQSLRSLSIDVHEKNYVPYIYNGELYIIANFSPLLRIIKADGEAGNFVFSEQHKGPSKIEWPFGNIRGGTPFTEGPERNDPWQYAFIHSSMYMPNGNFVSRYYVYSILRFNPETYEVQLIEEPLAFSEDEQSLGNTSTRLLNSIKNLSIKVVFPMGVIQYGDGIIISYGKDDCASKLKYYSWNYIRLLFKGK